MNENEISFYIRKSIFEIYNELGPGLLEKVYEKTLAYVDRLISELETL